MNTNTQCLKTKSTTYVLMHLLVLHCMFEYNQRSMKLFKCQQHVIQYKGHIQK